MSGQAITIADKDAKYRNRISRYFQKAGYQVRTVGSAQAALESVLENETSVLLLGSNLVESAFLADLLHLLKTCGSHLQVIMVSEAMTLAETRKVREEGIFYHALKPASAGDTDELRQAVTCAFEHRADQSATLHSQAVPAPTVADPEFGRVTLEKTLAWIAGAIALSFGAGVLSLQARPAHAVSSLAVWVFLGFVALVITNQILPIFRIKLVLASLQEWKAARSSHGGGK